MRRLNPNIWYRKYAITILVLIALALSFPLACGEAQPHDGTPPTSFWIKLTGAPRAPGPYTYITREPITLADGSQVVCMATLEALWCRDANE